jgi:Replication-relaxation
MPPGHSGTTRLLNRMAYPDCKENTRRDGLSYERFCKLHSLIKVNRIPKNQNAPFFFHLPNVVGLREQNWKHEKLCGDLYAAYQTTWSLQRWDSLPDEEMLSLGLIPDRSSIIDGRIAFWEVDRGTETRARLRTKVELYIKLSQLHRDQRFHVVFVTETSGRAESVLFDVLEDFRRGNQFVVGLHKSIIAEPFGKVFASPLEPEKALSLTDLV